MYAVFQSGGKQYLAKKGKIIRLEKLDNLIGDIIELNKVLMIVENNKVDLGKPYIKNKKIIAIVVAHGKHNKIMIIKFKRRKHFMKRQGHRQLFTDIKITNIDKL
ncbi:MAG: 50S ribosomal protein L21 [Enterobacterales bacterium]